MGKTEKGAIWQNKDLLSPYDYWQFWRNTDDRDVKKFLNFFTDLETEEVEKLTEKEKNKNKLKVILANEATKIVHGNEASKKAELTAKDTFEGKGLGLDLPEIKVKLEEIKKGINILDLLSKKKNMSSNSEARRSIANKGLKINNILIVDDKRIIEVHDFKEKH